MPARADRCSAVERCRSIASHWLARTFPVTPYPTKPSPRHQLCAVSPQPIPPRRYRRSSLSVRRCCHLFTDRSYASARPRGLVPVPSPLPCPGVATRARLDAPLGLFPQDGVSSWLRSRTPKGAGLEAGGKTLAVDPAHTGWLDLGSTEVDRGLAGVGDSPGCLPRPASWLIAPGASAARARSSEDRRVQGLARCVGREVVAGGCQPRLTAPGRATGCLLPSVSRAPGDVVGSGARR